jgi:hypothetical protein
VFCDKEGDRYDEEDGDGDEKGNTERGRER